MSEPGRPGHLWGLVCQQKTRLVNLTSSQGQDGLLYFQNELHLGWEHGSFLTRSTRSTQEPEDQRLSLALPSHWGLIAWGCLLDPREAERSWRTGESPE